MEYTTDQVFVGSDDRLWHIVFEGPSPTEPKPRPRRNENGFLRVFLHSDWNEFAWAHPDTLTLATKFTVVVDRHFEEEIEVYAASEDAAKTEMWRSTRSVEWPRERANIQDRIKGACKAEDYWPGKFG